MPEHIKGGSNGGVIESLNKRLQKLEPNSPQAKILNKILNTINKPSDRQTKIVEKRQAIVEKREEIKNKQIQNRANSLQKMNAAKIKRNTIKK